MIKDYFLESIQAKQDFIDRYESDLEEIIQLTQTVLERGNKILIAGNGGSAADAQHWAAEFIGRYKMERASLPAIALSTDTSALTAIGNDYGYEVVFLVS